MVTLTLDEKSIRISFELTFIPSCVWALASRLEFNVPIAAMTDTSRSVGIGKSLTGSFVCNKRLNFMVVTILSLSPLTEHTQKKKKNHSI